jgi:hypothetical protein
MSAEHADMLEEDFERAAILGSAVMLRSSKCVAQQELGKAWMSSYRVNVYPARVQLPVGGAARLQ